MKKLLLLSILGLYACTGTPTTEITGITIESTHFTRSGDVQEMDVSFNGKKIVLSAADIVMIRQMNDSENDEAQELLELRQTFMGADKEAQLLDVNFVMSEEPVENGIFIFGIETTNDKDLVIEMFDEEGFGMVANNSINISEGNNYKALNLNAIEDGEYVFRLKDEQGKELERIVVVQHDDPAAY